MSRLEAVSLPFRECTVVKNDYGCNAPYSSGHANALSTGDESGKGELNNSVGGATDIKTRKTLIAKNCYDSNRQYNAGTA
jgi:hypothetical protein